MNRAFAEATTSAAFVLALSKNQCNTLLRLEGFSPAEWSPNDVLLQVGTLKTLEARGLVWWTRDETGRPWGFQGLTAAGSLLVALLKEAGMTIDNTNSVSMLKRLARVEGQS